MAAPRAEPAERAAPRARRRNQRSDLGARVLAAIPAIVFAIFIVDEGGLVFALGAPRARDASACTSSTR